MTTYTPEFWKEWATANGHALAPYSEELISQQEARLGCGRLPPSYRNLLLTVGCLPGVETHFECSTLLPPEELVWFREANEDWIRAYEEPAGENDDMGEWKVSDLRKTLQVTTITDSLFLLNPNVVDEATGEWKAWLWANWVPGAAVSASFGDLLTTSVAQAADFAAQENERRLATSMDGLSTNA